MKIIVDAMGGDYAPQEIVLGSIQAANDLGIDIIFVGQEEKIKPYIENTDSNKIEIVDAREIITNDESPVTAIRKKKDSSIVKGLNLLKDSNADAMVSAGSTGALMAGGLFILGRYDKVDRPAIASFMPNKKKPILLLDLGANSEVKPKNLVQFAFIGSVYVQEVLKIKEPKVGLLNIGVEAEKGNSVVKSAYSMLKDIEQINFIGNVEARDFFDSDADVVVCDGFTGNIFLKTIEGLVTFFINSLKEGLSKDETTMAALVPALKAVKASMDFSEYGGAMFLGLNGTLIKCHGSSDRKSIYQGIKAAKKFAEADINCKIKKSLDLLE
jgi:glycerol-3-phosphate acyltransferase PlsX